MIRAAYAAWQAKTVTELTPLARVVEALTAPPASPTARGNKLRPSLHSPHLSLPDVAKPLPSV